MRGDHRPEQAGVIGGEIEAAREVEQIAAFLFPLLVLVSLLLATTLTFALAPVYIGALALAALALWQVTGDGEAAEFEGWALVSLYVILATLTLYE